MEFFQKRGHVVIPSSPLVPENDPTTLFVSAGMQPLINNILGAPHPSGKRLVNSQKAVRLQDIEEVGDNRHTTFFEMLGNWSLGDYFKKEQISWIWEFLTTELDLSRERLYVSVFAGDKEVPRDEESVNIWKKLGVPEKRIFYYEVNKNWWSRAGVPSKMPVGEPGGPDSEVFFEFTQVRHDPKFGKECHPNCDCGRFMEIANSVFMQYRKTESGDLEELPKKSVDFGGGLERLVAATNDNPDVFTSDLFSAMIQIIEAKTKKKYLEDEIVTRNMRIVTDHLRAAVMMSTDGVMPSNKMQGYILRRLVRRSLLYGRNLGLSNNWQWVGDMVEPVVEIYKEQYPEVGYQKDKIKLMLEDEAMKFGKSLEKGLREIEKLKKLDGKMAFQLYETYGFPWEMTVEIAAEKGQTVDRTQFEEEFNKHKELSRTAAAGMFKGGLQDQSEETTKLHTATHLLHQALRTVLGNHVSQKGSNITAERLRFDFSHSTKLTTEEINKVEEIVNEKIGENLSVSFQVLNKYEALKSGALAFFGERYADKVKVYTIGQFSREICGGPHVNFTGVLGTFTIVKEESAGSGVRRIYAQVSTIDHKQSS